MRPFDAPPAPWAPGHRGVDLAARLGDPVRAPAPGTVVFAGPVAGRPVLVIAHAVVSTTYEPVIATVPIGARVDTGQIVGTVAAGAGGAAHCRHGPCLHWGVRYGRTYLDPLGLLQLRRLRLLPPVIAR
ncbi:MAG: peptidoglycan DD-metalloendopeptidase family protein [Actinomycetes bacterium]